MPLSHPPAAEVEVCGDGPLLTQVTVPPTATVSTRGEKAKSDIVIVTCCGGGCVPGPVPGSSSSSLQPRANAATRETRAKRDERWAEERRPTKPEDMSNPPELGTTGSAARHLGAPRWRQTARGDAEAGRVCGFTLASGWRPA